MSAKPIARICGCKITKKNVYMQEHVKKCCLFLGNKSTIASDITHELKIKSQ